MVSTRTSRKRPATPTAVEGLEAEAETEECWLERFATAVEGLEAEEKKEAKKNAATAVVVEAEAETEKEEQKKAVFFGIPKLLRNV